MATLKWNNVTGDHTNAGSAALKQAGSLFSRAFENFSGAVEGRKKRVTEANTANVLNELRGITSTSDFAAREGEFDLNSILQQTEGEVDTTAISKALASKRPELREEETRVRNELLSQLPGTVLTANQPGVEGALDYKGQVASVSQQVRDAGGTSQDVNKAVASLKTQLDERASLSPQAQVAVTQKNKELDILSQAAQGQAKQELDTTLAANPISHTLNAEGDAIAIGDVHKKIRNEYPQGSIFGGLGGDALSEQIGKYQTNGITKAGSVGLKVGDKFKEGTVKVEPWMYTLALDIAGQTAADSFGSPTVTANLFKETLADIAFDPKYKAYAANAAKAKRDFARRTTELQLSRLKEGANFTKDIKSSQSVNLLKQLQREAK